MLELPFAERKGNRKVDAILERMLLQEIASADVIIYTESTCKYCTATTELFNNMQMEANKKRNSAIPRFYTRIIELDTISNRDEVQSALLQISGQKSVPNVFVRGRHVGGNGPVQAAAESGELIEMLKMDLFEMSPSKPTDAGDEKKISYDKIDTVKSSLEEKYELLMAWEKALAEVEESIDLLGQGKIGPNEINSAMGALSEVSMMQNAEAVVMDVGKIQLPSEGCDGMDYIPLDQQKEVIEVDEEEESEDEEEESEDEDEVIVEVVGGIDMTALDYASDAPVRLEDAQSAYDDLLKLAKHSVKLLVETAAGPSSHAKRWVEQMIQQELRKKEVDKKPPSIDEFHQLLTLQKTAMPTPSYSDDSYTSDDAIRDIDRLLETEDADRTGKFDYASVKNGAYVLRRGPHATSYSLYETLPLLNRILSYTKLRFYGHPPEAALLPTSGMYGSGQCWSFPNEYDSLHARKQSKESIVSDGIRGEFATLTVSLASAITVSEVAIEHATPTQSSDPATAIKEFRVVGFEDSGAYGDPWELGTYTFFPGQSMKVFSIPTMLDGQNVPKLKSVAIAVDSNNGAEYSCLYRVRVHGS